MSPSMLDELHRILTTKFEFNPKFAGKIRFRIAQVADLYNPTSSIRVIPGKHFDNFVLETAVLGKAKYLVTGDRKHLLPIKIHRNEVSLSKRVDKIKARNFHKIPIVSPNLRGSVLQCYQPNLEIKNSSPLYF